ncbi:hypothetical protein GCM10023205_10040 [Yinghuangia aomiensis]|uniref:Uncharacterized protein n=1 Tax=Yinghuangia aomiensis TaxID=676205 RepID=A0ABP9GS54_9ACTN
MTTRLARPLLAVAALLAAMAGVLLGTPAHAASAAPAASAASDNRDADHVVFVGIPGLRWSDVTPERTPNLAGLTGHASAATLSVRTVEKTTCPADGWLTVGSGARSSAPRQDGACAPLPAVAAGPDGTVTVPDLPRIADFNTTYSYDPKFGTLAATAARGNQCVTAVGPGAALATADAQGRSPAAYLPGADALDAAALARCGLTLVDLGALTDGAPDRDARLRAADEAVGRIAGMLPERTELVVAGPGDGGTTGTPHLRTLLATGPGTRFDGGYLTAPSTRYDGMAQLTDLAPSLLDPLGIDPPSELVGSVVARASGPTGAAAVRDLNLIDVGAQAARDVRETYQFFTWLTVVPLVLFAAGIAAAARMRKRGAPDASRRKLYRALQVVGVTAGTVPGATFLVGLFPWEKAGSPEAALVLLSLGWTAVLTALAFAGPWRRSPYGPPGFAAAATALILAADVVTGSNLQMNTLFGLSPLVAGRFYGFGNVAWSVFGPAVLLAVAWPVGLRLGAGRRRAALAVLAAGALAAIVVDGWPAFGSDFGGVLALVPGFAVLGLLLFGIRISWGKAALVAAGAVTTVAIIAVFDWMRPAAGRSHLGKFVQQVIDGDAGSVLHRKVADNLSSFHGPIAYLIPVLYAVLLVAILAPHRIRATALPPAYERIPWLRAVLLACWIAAAVGYAANDSGIQIPSVALLIGLPLPAAALAAVAAERAGRASRGDGSPARPQAQPQGAE